MGQVFAGGENLLGGHVPHERLAAEPRLDGHDEDDVEQAAIRIERTEWCLRLDREPRRPAGGPDPAQGGFDLGRLHFDVERHRIAARIEELVDVLQRVADHQVRVERQLRPGPDALDHLRPEGQVRDEVAIHHVDVEPVGAGPLGSPDRVRHVRMVGVEDAHRHPRAAAGHG